MTALGVTKVHVFSYIPRVAEVLGKTFPILDVCSVKCEGNSDKSAVTEKELLKLQEATILITDSNLLAQVYEKLPNLAWAQLSFAGVEPFITTIKKNSVIPNFPVTRCASFNQPMAEYTIAWIINHSRNFMGLREFQKQRIWNRDMSKLPLLNPSLKAFTVGIAGVGEIGKAIVGYLKVFNSRVLGYGRSNTSPKDAQLDGYWYGEQLSDFLAECDYIVNVLPSTPETVGLFGGQTLQSAKKKPVFINIGRGSVISNKDIINALDNNWISFAILDVFSEEPLPTTDPLWVHPKVLITPHIAANTTADEVVNTFKLNFERFNSKKALKYEVDWSKGY